MVKLDDNYKLLLEKQQYRIVGNHSAVKLCTWLKKSLRGDSVCYKEKFYGIKSHRCLQMTPAVAWCPNKCVFCWRSTDKTEASELGSDSDDPEEILDGAIRMQRSLITGFKGFSGTDMVKWEEAQDPINVAISLTGEPTAYPKIAGLIDVCNKRGFTTFLVTNGQFPDTVQKICDMGGPTQFYLSIDAPTKELYKKTCVPMFKDYWSRFEKTINTLSKFKGKKAVRLTLVKGLNMDDFENYVKLILKVNPKFVEVKAYMWVGFSKHRLDYDAMPVHSEVLHFAEKLAKLLNYSVTNESEASRVVLLERK
ncbi:MAG: 4-demethylwyosine synthase TYW1 [DPANN group archaeon]|nr:4-demethylwyosine synthase TYW1 [DPANN group archaeon]